MSILIYIFPALFDALAAQALFVNSLRIAKTGAPDLVITGLWAAWSVVYVLICFAMSRLLTERNAARCVYISCILFFLSGIGNLFGNSAVSIYLWSIMVAIACGFFFPPFQVFMKKVDRGGNKHVSYSTGLYTFSWSVGFAVGPWISGFLMETGHYGWKLAFKGGAGVAVLGGILLWFFDKFILQNNNRHVNSSFLHTDGIEVEKKSLPDLAWLGWVGATAGLMAISIIRGIFPALGEKELHLPESVQGNVFFLLSIVQAITGLAMVSSRRWMYNPRWVGLFGFIGACGLFLFAVGKCSYSFYVAASLFGIYSGSFYFYFVFHSLIHPEKAPFYVSINETLVGVMGFAAPLIAGGISQTTGSYGLTFLFGLVVVCIVTIFQVVIHYRLS